MKITTKNKLVKAYKKWRKLENASKGKVTRELRAAYGDYGKLYLTLESHEREKFNKYLKEQNFFNL